jgi:hypothetical protein
MMSRKMLAVVGSLAIVAILTGGALAVATNSPSETPAATTTNSVSRTPDQGSSSPVAPSDAVDDDDGTLDQGPGDVPTGDGDEDGDLHASPSSGPGNGGSDDDNSGPSENSGPGSLDDEDGDEDNVGEGGGEDD